MRYVSSDEDADFVAELSFDALTHEDIHDRKLPPLPSNARLAVRHRRADFARVLDLGNVSVPGAPWFHARLVAFVAGTLFVGVDDGLLLVDPASGTIVQRIPTGNTPVSAITPDLARDQLYVVNDYYGFERRGVGSNLAAFTPAGTLAWRASVVAQEWSGAKDYTQVMAVTATTLEVATWTGRAELDAVSGRLLRWCFTK